MAWRLADRSLDGLTDEEFLWEPAPGCWSLRRKPDLRTPLEEGAPPGDWWIDWAYPAPTPPPLTTIAWRVTHMILGTWNWNDIIAGREVAPEPSPPASASASVALWREVTGRFRSTVASFSEYDAWAEVPAWGGSVARWYLVGHVLHEVVHHSAEVGCLRDMYRSRV